MKPLLLIFLFCFFCGCAFSQSFYATDFPNKQFKRIYISGSNITVENITGCPRSATSIALHHKVMYYIAEKVLYQADLVGNTLTNCVMLGNVTNSNSLTVDKKGLLYLTDDGRSLRTFNPATKEYKNLGPMPYSAAGDMVFYKDNLYMASVNGIVKVDISNPANSTIVIASPASILGLASVSVSSTVNKVYALNDNSPISSTTIIEVDLDNYQMGQTIGLAPTLYDAASEVEDGSNLALTIDDVATYADCPFTGKGSIKVISYNATSFKLTNETTKAVTPSTTGLFNNVAPGNYTITVSNALESVSAPYPVAEFKFVTPVVTQSVKKPACLNTGEITIETDKAGGDFDILYKGVAYGSSHTFTGLKAGTYPFDIRNAAGCVVMTVNVPLDQDACPINIDSASVSEECESPNKAHIVMHPTPSTDVYTYAIGNAAPSNTGIFSNLDAGQTYIINITSKGGGSKQYPVTVPDYSLNKPTVTYDKTDASCSVNASVKFNLSDNSGAYTIVYNSASYPFNHLFLLPESGMYNFKILKPNGCVLSNVAVPIAKVDCEIVNFPNTFSPNGDGINDIFRPTLNAVTDKLQIKIYNRLGSLVFTSDSSRSGWDGQTGGKPAPSGVYYWIASYINNEKLSKSQNGYITLIR